MVVLRSNSNRGSLQILHRHRHLPHRLGHRTRSPNSPLAGHPRAHLPSLRTRGEPPSRFPFFPEPGRARHHLDPRPLPHPPSPLPASAPRPPSRRPPLPRHRSPPPRAARFRPPPLAAGLLRKPPGLARLRLRCSLPPSLSAPPRTSSHPPPSTSSRAAGLHLRCSPLQPASACRGPPPPLLFSADDGAWR